MNVFVRRHSFIYMSTIKFSTSDRRAFQRDVYDYARGIGLGTADATHEVLKARQFCGAKDVDGNDSSLENEVNDSEAISSKLESQVENSPTKPILSTPYPDIRHSSEVKRARTTPHASGFFENNLSNKKSRRERDDEGNHSKSKDKKRKRLDPDQQQVTQDVSYGMIIDQSHDGDKKKRRKSKKPETVVQDPSLNEGLFQATLPAEEPAGSQGLQPAEDPSIIASQKSQKEKVKKKDKNKDRNIDKKKRKKSKDRTVGRPDGAYSDIESVALSHSEMVEESPSKKRKTRAALKTSGGQRTSKSLSDGNGDVPRSQGSLEDPRQLQGLRSSNEPVRNTLDVNGESEHSKAVVRTRAIDHEAFQKPMRPSVSIPSRPITNAIANQPESTNDAKWKQWKGKRQRRPSLGEEGEGSTNGDATSSEDEESSIQGVIVPAATSAVESEDLEPPKINNKKKASGFQNPNDSAGVTAVEEEGLISSSDNDSDEDLPDMIGTKNFKRKDTNRDSLDDPVSKPSGLPGATRSRDSEEVGQLGSDGIVDLTSPMRPVMDSSPSPSTPQRLRGQRQDNNVNLAVRVPLNTEGLVQTPQTPQTPRSKTTSHSSPFFDRLTAEKVSCLKFPSLDSEEFGLVQEKLSQEPLKLLIAVTLLNQTRGSVAIPICRALMEKYQTTERLAAADAEEVATILRPLGLHNKRALVIINMAKAWLKVPPQKGKRYRRLNYPRKGDGRDVAMEEEPLSDEDPREAWEIAHLAGVGNYAMDSWRIFCRDALRGIPTGLRSRDDPADMAIELQQEWTRVLPSDKELRWYLRWRWLRIGYLWNSMTGERLKVSTKVVSKMEQGEIRSFEGYKNPWLSDLFFQEERDSIQSPQSVKSVKQESDGSMMLPLPSSPLNPNHRSDGRYKIEQTEIEDGKVKEEREEVDGMVDDALRLLSTETNTFHAIRPEVKNRRSRRGN